MSGMQHSPTVGRCEVYGHSEIELCPGGRWSTSESFRAEMLVMCQCLQMGAHLQMSRSERETHQKLSAVTYEAHGGGSAATHLQYSLWQCFHIQVLRNTVLCWYSKSLYLTIFMLKTMCFSKRLIHIIYQLYSAHALVAYIKTHINSSISSQNNLNKNKISHMYRALR